MSAPAQRRRILACDDEPQVLRALRVIFRERGCDVLTASTTEEALGVIAVHPVDAAVVDLVLPGSDGVELCRRLRAGSDMPIIVLSAVDDYMTKPFSPRELIARLEAVLRRAAAPDREGRVAFDGLQVDLIAHTVHRDDQEIHLTPLEYALLQALVRNRGRLLTHHALMTAAWGSVEPADTQALRTHIARLRRKIEPPPPSHRHYIHTEAGVGFRFDPV
jgi:two-component system, OmpR family, KDP operon response regulator KdpE